MTSLQTYLNQATISPTIFTLRPDYRALLIAISNLPPGGPSTPESSALLSAAEASASTLLQTTPVTELPHISAWRETYKAFGAKPAKYRNSLESLTRRVATGLPRVNRLTDIYNAVSVKYQIPLGGEDLDKYVGAPFLIRATGKEEFEVKGGEVETVDAGEVVWCDGKGVTCRRWNWRQGPRTALDEGTERVLVIMDALEPVTDEVLEEAAGELIGLLKGLGEGVEVAQRVIRKE